MQPFLLGNARGPAVRSGHAHSGLLFIKDRLIIRAAWAGVKPHFYFIDPYLLHLSPIAKCVAVLGRRSGQILRQVSVRFYKKARLVVSPAFCTRVPGVRGAPSAPCGGLETATHFPDAEVVELPVADGGEGSVDCFLTAMGGRKKAMPIWNGR